MALPDQPTGKLRRKALREGQVKGDGARGTESESFARNRAFTLVELMVAMTLLAIITGIVMQITSQTGQIWRSSTARIQAFQEARAAFESMTRTLSQATLNTYYDYYNSNNQPRTAFSGAALAAFTPASYDRISDLHFVSGHAGTLLQNSPAPVTTQTHAVFFQAPIGYSVNFSRLNNALNACGYFLKFDDAADSLPAHVRNSPTYEPRYRFRLMEMTQPTEQLGIYAPGVDMNSAAQSDWFRNHAASGSRVVAENVIALVLLPKLSNHEDVSGVAAAPNFNYNSRIPLKAASDPAWSGANPPFPGAGFTSTREGGSSVNASRHHQLPPLMRVVMIVIEEASAARLQGTSTTPPAAIDLSSTNLFRDADKLEQDIQSVEDILNAMPGNLTGNTQQLTYRVFNTDIIMREAKWSNN